ncbi:MAG: hypothetical protein HKN45_04085 [Flavobacteriales bacterium]|nr:hypothetical protein [Flavobacteriales bacterium]NNK80167.1 hypothetical protein [Flavobacteriales bacterium]
MSDKTAHLIGNVVKILVALLGVIFCALIIANNSEIEMGESHNYVSGALTISLIGMIVCVGIALLFGLVYFVKNIAKSKGMLIGLVVFAIMIVISYSMADGGLTQDWIGRGVTETASKLSGTGIYLTGILLAVTVIVALFSEVNKLFK